MTKKWTCLSREEVYKEYRTVEARNYKLPNDSEKIFDIKIETPAIAVLALTPEKKIILATQYRPGPEEIIHELPGGAVDPGEDTLTAVARELQEETGYQGSLVHTISYNVCAYSTQVRHCYVATDCKQVSEQKLDDGEFIDITLMDIDAFKEYLHQGHITDTTCAFAGLKYLDVL